MERLSWARNVAWLLDWAGWTHTDDDQHVMYVTCELTNTKESRGVFGRRTARGEEDAGLAAAARLQPQLH